MGPGTATVWGLSMDRTLIRFTLNGEDREAWVWPHRLLLHLLHDELGASEVRYGCGEGVCATCTVLVDGESVNSCLLLAVQVDGRAVTTVGGLSDGEELHPLQESFLHHGASQCGFCTPGMLLSALEFVQANPSPSRQEIRRALAGNLCRCTGYTKIVDAVEAYARGLPGTGPVNEGG
jgi:carbon-monoxide dehydrogenase small subunit